MGDLGYIENKKINVNKYIFITQMVWFDFGGETTNNI